MSADGANSAAANVSDARRKLIERRLRQRPAAPAARAETIPRRAGAGPRMASAGERWIFLGSQANPASASPNITSSFRVHGHLDVPRFERALSRVVQRHEILRSVYRAHGTAVEVTTLDTVSISVTRIRCATEAELLARAERAAGEPFDLGSAPPLRLYYLEAPGAPGLLMLVTHDIVFDKWSLGLFWKEISACYSNDGSSPATALPDLAIQYGDFAEWQEKWLQGERQERQLAYWRSQLAGLPQPLSLPADRPYPLRWTEAGRLERARIPASTTTALKQLAASENASMFTLLLATFQTLLHRYTGAGDIVVGTPVANRRLRETADIIGFLLNTVAVRTRVDGSASPREILRQVRQTVYDAIEHQDVSFDRVVEAVNPPRLPGRHPVFQSMFVYQRQSEAQLPLTLEGVAIEPTMVETRTAKFDLTLFVAESGDGLETILEYRTDLFDQPRMQQMLEHYAELLDGISRSPDRPIAEIDYITPRERALLFDAWQGGRLPLDGRPDVVTRISDRATASPDSLAVAGAGMSVSYGEIERASDEISRTLARAGAGPGAMVAHFMDRTPDAIAGILGILKTGAAYVPIDPAYPEDRCRFIASDSGARLAITSPALQDRAAQMFESYVVSGSSPADHSYVVPGFSRTNLETSSRHNVTDGAGQTETATAGSDPPAYVIYTSGSTGTPKGVVVSRHNLLHSTEARFHYYQRAPGRYLLVPSFSFDSSIAGIFWTLASGGTLVLPAAEDVREPARLAALIRETKVSDLLCIPSLYRELLRAHASELSTVTRVIVAGEACPPDLVRLHFERLPNAALHNEYGPTEVSVWSTVHRCTPDDGVLPAVPIGRPIANTLAFVLDAHDRPLPAGHTGELTLGGAGLVRGYLGREELTAERFIWREFPGLGRTRLYRTGDRARWRADGVLEFLGRIDAQLKLRGYRIEPGEIEAVLQQHPAVERAVVVATSSSARTADDVKRLASRVTATDLNAMLDEIESTAPMPSSTAADRSTAERVARRKGFRLELHTTNPDFVAPPRPSQRNWILARAMEEFAEDLEQLDRASRSFVRGHEHRLESDLRDITQAALGDQEIMETWQEPLMRVMARHVAESHGHVLEIGFGRGVSAEFIQQSGVASHTIVESNDHSVRRYFEPWRERHRDADIRLLHGRWQDVLDQLGQYDGIFFHAFPMNEQEFSEYVLKSVTFAEHAFAAMAERLHDGGVFTYLTTEIDSLSRGHQRRLLRHFRSISLHVEPLQVPEDTRDTWWAHSMVVVKAVK